MPGSGRGPGAGPGRYQKDVRRCGMSTEEPFPGTQGDKVTWEAEEILILFIGFYYHSKNSLSENRCKSTGTEILNVKYV